jgi:hypothetical protein
MFKAFNYVLEQFKNPKPIKRYDSPIDMEFHID